MMTLGERIGVLIVWGIDHLTYRSPTEDGERPLADLTCLAKWLLSHPAPERSDYVRGELLLIVI